jgi:hypothetical protein
MAGFQLGLGVGALTEATSSQTLPSSSSYFYSSFFAVSFFKRVSFGLLFVYAVFSYSSLRNN